MYHGPVHLPANAAMSAQAGAATSIATQAIIANRIPIAFSPGAHRAP
jgi:hypothetical protein